jgi:hypothetical protein
MRNMVMERRHADVGAEEIDQRLDDRAIGRRGGGRRRAERTRGESIRGRGERLPPVAHGARRQGDVVAAASVIPAAPPRPTDHGQHPQSHPAFALPAPSLRDLAAREDAARALKMTVACGIGQQRRMAPRAAGGGIAWPG